MAAAEAEVRADTAAAAAAFKRRAAKSSASLERKSTSMRAREEARALLCFRV